MERPGFSAILTPVCKAYGSEASYDSIVLAIQCYGGYGFSEEFPLAQMLRDCKVFPIYEGTNGIQAMDLLGRKVVMKGGASFRRWLAKSPRPPRRRAARALKDMADKVDAACGGRRYHPHLAIAWAATSSST